jgi:hypothetical protein
MTAEELAEQIEITRFLGNREFSFKEEFITQVCTMLRQQEKEIEQLKNDIVKQQEFVCQQAQTIKRYHNMVRDKDVNIEYLREKLIASIDDIKTLKCQQMTIKFRQTHWEQLLSYIQDVENIGYYYGNKEQFLKRHFDIKNWVEEQLKKASE